MICKAHLATDTQGIGCPSRARGCMCLTASSWHHPSLFVARDLLCPSSSPAHYSVWQRFEGWGLPQGTAHPAGQKCLPASQRGSMSSSVSSKFCSYFPGKSEAAWRVAIKQDETQESLKMNCWTSLICSHSTSFLTSHCHLCLSLLTAFKI